jgi:hypothetical protein
MAESGVLNAAASPAAAPASKAGLRSCLAAPSRPATLEAIAPAIWTVGPSLPRLEPPPMVIRQPKTWLKRLETGDSQNPARRRP